MEEKGVIKVHGGFGEVIWTLPPDIKEMLLELKEKDKEILKFMETEDPKIAKLLKEKFNSSAYKMFDEEFTRMLKGQFHFFTSMLAVPSCFLIINQEVSETILKLLLKMRSIMTNFKKTPPC